MDYLVLLVIVVLIVILYLTLNKSKSSVSSLASNVASTDPADTSFSKPNTSGPVKSVKNSCPRIGAPLCGGENPEEYAGYNNYSTYATYYH
jgi:hypothetical protein